MFSLKSRFGKGIAVFIVLSIIGGILWIGISQFLRAAGVFEAFLIKIGFESWIVKPISYFVIIVLIWVLGHINLASAIKWFFGNLAKKKAKERKFLFCVRLPSVLNGYPVALVSRVYSNDEGKLVYNIVFPNLGGMWTFIEVPAEDTIRDKRSAEEILLTSLSAGFL